MNIVLRAILEPLEAGPHAETRPRRGTTAFPIPREEYELGVTWLAERTGLSRAKVRGMLDIVPADWPQLDAAISALNDYLEDLDQAR
jgi:hypothetical protein